MLDSNQIIEVLLNICLKVIELKSSVTTVLVYQQSSKLCAVSDVMYCTFNSVIQGTCK